MNPPFLQRAPAPGAGPLPACGRRPVRRRFGAHEGFTLIELTAVLFVTLVLLGIATPRLLESNATVAVLNARAAVSSAASLARAAATRYGRVSYLVLDVAADRVRVEVDTTLAGGVAPVPVHVLDLWADLQVDLRASEPLVCFDPRGLTLASGVCPGTTVVVWVERDAASDSLVVAATGRVTP